MWGVKIKIWTGLKAMFFFRRTYGPPGVAVKFWAMRVITRDGLRAFKGTYGPAVQANGRIPGIGKKSRGPGVVFMVKAIIRVTKLDRRMVTLTRPSSEPLFVGMTAAVRRSPGIEGVPV